jgi:antitoxin (DNA-binding transcriptional repressor) of toxin-antitoxin stability system
MKGMKVAEARARFGEILDEAESGAAVVIERRGVRFRLTAEQPRRPRRNSPALFEAVDASVLDGQWTWQPGPAGLTFSARRKRR